MIRPPLCIVRHPGAMIGINDYRNA